jgi:hypothetical protein
VTAPDGADHAGDSEESPRASPASHHVARCRGCR